MLLWNVKCSLIRLVPVFPFLDLCSLAPDELEIISYRGCRNRLLLTGLNETPRPRKFISVKYLRLLSGGLGSGSATELLSQGLRAPARASSPAPVGLLRDECFQFQPGCRRHFRRCLNLKTAVELTAKITARPSRSRMEDRQNHGKPRPNPGWLAAAGRP